jgi:site-specific DNA-cytosine methylase
MFKLKPLNVLSLFDGMSCGRQALKQAGIPVAKYFASEIDKYAIKIAQKNYHDNIQFGDVTKIETTNGLLLTGSTHKIDLIIGGSPCQGFSFAGKELNFEDPRSKLFFEFVRLIKELKPKYFMLENVKMKKEYLDVISKHLGVQPIFINSSLVSAQGRQRYYWANFPISQPADKNIEISDILELGGEQAGRVVGRRIKNGKRADNDKTIKAVQRFELNENPMKTNCLTTVQKDNVILFKSGERRYLTPIEYERLQTLPDNYTEGVSYSQRYKMLGNGWTVSVIEHIFRCMKNVTV